MHWQTLAVAGMAAIGAAVVAMPASAAPSGLQTHEMVTTSDGMPEITLASHRRHGGYRRYRDDDDFNVFLGFPFFAYGGYGGYPYRHRYNYYNDNYDDSYLHCHGRRYWRYGKVRCAGRWHRHYN
jgi:hypothetical protein